METLSLALSVLGDFRSRPPDAKALAKGKSYLLGQFPLKVESPEALAGAPRRDRVLRAARRTSCDVPEPRRRGHAGRVAARAANTHMPPVDAVAITVVGNASAIRGPLEAAFGPVTVVAPAECDELAPRMARRSPAP